MFLKDGVYHWYAASYGECAEPKGSNGCADFGVGNCGFATNHNVSLWTSPDLVTWTPHGVVFEAEKNLPPNSVLFAPKTVYNPNTEEYVMWFNYIVDTFSNSYYGVATSKTAQGPFEFVVKNVTTLRYSDNGDENLFVDDDGTGYLLYTSIAEGHKISVESLTNDYLGTLGENASSGFVGADFVEAPMMFKRNSVYYVVFGSCCCYCGTGTVVSAYTSTSPLGPYTPYARGNLSDLMSQSTDIFRYVDANGESQFMYVGDHWQSAPDGIKGHDFTVWAPIQFDSQGTVSSSYHDNFSIEITIS